MTPLQFVEKWKQSALRERQGSQSHFIELCDILGEPRPSDPDAYCFERGAEKVGGGDGWADVWRKGCFAWEYKGRHGNLGAALRQLQTYTLDLQMPPYLIVSDMERIVVHTNWNNTVSDTHVFTLDNLLDAQKRDLLKQIFNGSERLKPQLSPLDLTAKAAERFGDIGRRLQDRGHDPRTVAHFLNRIIFCMFAEDAGLLPNNLFTRMMKAVEKAPDLASAQLSDLFGKMHQKGGGFFGVERVEWFNGGLFDGEDVLPLELIDLKDIAKTADEHDWSEIDPAIFGTLFEQALKARRERAALGAHYTDREKILKIVEPVITRPLMAEWEEAHAEIAGFMEEVRAADAAEKAIREEAAVAMAADPKKAREGEEARRKRTTAIRRERNKGLSAARERLDAFLDRLAAFRVLDPACGSGNFLYVALHALHDIERRALNDSARLGVDVPQVPRVSVKQMRGIEIERYAAELARVTLWIGDLQWRIKNGYTAYEYPILATLDQIEERDALLDRSVGDDPSEWPEATWPETDVIIGNPPFLGAKKQSSSMDAGYLANLRRAFEGRVPGLADFVTYWFVKAGDSCREGRSKSAGLVGTNSIRDGSGREALQTATEDLTIFEAYSDEEWVVDGAAVRVSLVCFGSECNKERRLDGFLVGSIDAALSADTVLSKQDVARLEESEDIAFIGIQKNGPFDVDEIVAIGWLRSPSNPNGERNERVLRRTLSGRDIMGRRSYRWIVDFTGLGENESALFEKPFAHVVSSIKPIRLTNNREGRRRSWWLFGETMPRMRTKIATLTRYIATSLTARHRAFVWVCREEVCDSTIVVIARDDDVAFGLVQSAAHELWVTRMGAWLGVGNDPRYTPTTTFETFPFPEGLTPNIPAAHYESDPRAIAIAEAARELNEKREAWLNPVEWVDRVPEVVPGYPDRIVPKRGHEDALKQRTLTKLYNERPAWLDTLHRRLDAVVAAAYGWPADLTDEQILEKLFALNQERAAASR